MHLQNFKVQEHTIKEFTEMCERFKSTLSDSPSSKQTNKGLSNKNNLAGTRNAVAITATRTTEKKITLSLAWQEFYPRHQQLSNP